MSFNFLLRAPAALVVFNSSLSSSERLNFLSFMLASRQASHAGDSSRSQSHSHTIADLAIEDQLEKAALASAQSSAAISVEDLMVQLL